MLTILKASAGSGKTYRLTRDYIQMLLGVKHVDDEGNAYYSLNRDKSAQRHRSILAITFTNKATDEMKVRIVHELAKLAEMELPDSNGKPQRSDYADYLTETFGCTRDELQREAARALRSMLFDFSYFNVSTIDSFFQLILRTFAYEAELEGDYNLDLDRDAAIDHAVTDLFSSLADTPHDPGTQRNINWITQFLMGELRRGNSINLFNRSSVLYSNFLKKVSALTDETFEINADELLSYLSSSRLDAWVEELDRTIDAIPLQTQTLFRSALAEIDSHPLRKGKYSANIINQLSKLENLDNFNDKVGGTTFPKVQDDPAEMVTSGARAEFSSTDFDTVRRAVKEAVDFHMLHYPLWETYREMRNSLFALGLISAINEKLRALRDENNLLLLSDTNTLLQRIMADEADAPFIFERIGLRLHNFLIDEFQDTSAMQWANIRPLINESQSHANDNLIIGDQKQSIYRFRGGDPQLIVSTVARQTCPPVQSEGDKEGQNTNYRSAAEVVNFNNRLFGSIRDLLDFKDFYGNVEQNIHNGDLHGYVHISPFIVPKGERASAEDFLKFACPQIVNHMKRQVANGYHGSDIAVLVRSNNDASAVVNFLVSTFAEDPFFSERDFRVVSDDSLLLSSSPAVRRIVSMLRLIATGANVREEFPDAEAGDKPGKRHFRSDEELMNLRTRYESLLGQGKDTSEALAEAVRLADVSMATDFGSLSDVHSQSLPEMVERIIEMCFGGQAPADQVQFVLAFQDLVIDFCQTSPTADVQSFMRRWDEISKKACVASAADVNSVRVMTVHKSKGLEFPCVFLVLHPDDMIKCSGIDWFEPVSLPGIRCDLMPPLIPMKPKSILDKTPFKSQYAAITRSSLLDEVNVLYVAFTRAVRELVAFYKPGSTDPFADGKPFVGSSLQNGVLLSSALRKLGFDVDKDATIGSPTAPMVEKKDNPHASLPTETFLVEPFAIHRRPEIWDFTSIETNAERAMGRSRGNVLHSILACTPSLAYLHKAVTRALSTGNLSIDLAEATEQLLRNAILSSPTTEGWFAEGVDAICERSILLDNGATERPDRVVLYDDGSADIIDYKFGAQTNKTHRAQLTAYANHYKKLGYEPVRAYVWFVERPEIRRIL